MKKWFILFLLIFSTFSISQNHPINCASFNVRYDNPTDLYSWNERKENIIQLFSDKNFDIIAMQEVLAHQLTDLETNMPNYTFVGVGRDDGNRKGEFCPIFLKKERFHIIDSGTFWLSQTPNKVSLGWDAACNRIVTWVRCIDKQSNKNILFLNTHLDHVGKIAQKQSSHLICQWIKNNHSDEKIIFTGDFNVNDESVVYKTIRLESNLADSHKVAKHLQGVGYSFHNFGKIPLKQRQKIDFIFVDKTFIVEQAGIIDEKLPIYKNISDHNLIWVNLLY